MASSSHTRPPPSGPRDGADSGQALGALAPSEPSPGASVSHLVEEARRASSAARRRELAGRINGELARLARGGGSREVADVLLGLLEGGALEGLGEASGHSCHAAAVEALLSLGFPYALEVRPEDLARLHAPARGAQAPGERGELAPLLVAVGGILGQFGWEVAGVGGAERSLPALSALMAFALVAAVLAPPRSKLRRLGVGGMAVVSVLAVLLSLLPGYGGGVSGLAGLLAAFLAARHESPEVGLHTDVRPMD